MACLAEMKTVNAKTTNVQLAHLFRLLNWILWDEWIIQRSLW